MADEKAKRLGVTPSKRGSYVFCSIGFLSFLVCDVSVSVSLSIY
jgi:hypothetical protein